MPKFLAVYDVKKTPNNPHSAVTAAALNNGWFVWILATNGTKSRLPNTTLDGMFDNYAAAERAFLATIAEARIKVGVVIVEKFAIAEYHDIHFDSDEKLQAA